MKKVCIAGYGAIAPIHARVLEQLPGVQLYAVCDPDPDAINRCRESYPVAAYRDYSQMLLDPQIDTVHICSPHHLHFPMIQAALQHGKQVVAEKPVTRTREEFDALIAMEGAENICVIIQNRYNSCIQVLKKLIADGDLGQILGVKGFMTWHKEPDYYLQSSWKGKTETEGGSCLINQALHTLDLMLYLGGPAETVGASMHNRTLQGIIETEDTVEACLRYASGARGLFYASNGYCVNSPVEIEVVGTKATARYAYKKLFVDGRQIADDDTVAPGQDYWGGGHYLLLEDYYLRSTFYRLKDIAPTMSVLFDIYAASNSIQN